MPLGAPRPATPPVGSGNTWLCPLPLAPPAFGMSGTSLSLRSHVSPWGCIFSASPTRGVMLNGLSADCHLVPCQHHRLLATVSHLALAVLVTLCPGHPVPYLKPQHSLGDVRDRKFRGRHQTGVLELCQGLRGSCQKSLSRNPLRHGGQGVKGQHAYFCGCAWHPDSTHVTSPDRLGLRLQSLHWQTKVLTAVTSLRLNDVMHTKPRALPA